MEQLGITVFDVAVIAVAVFGAVIGMSSGLRPCHPVHRLVDRRRLGRLAVLQGDPARGRADRRQHRAGLFHLHAGGLRRRPDRAGDADQRPVALDPVEPAGQARPHPGGRFRRPVRLGRGRRGLPVLRLSRTPHPAAGGRGRRHLPDGQGNGHFRRTLPAAGLPDPPAGPGMDAAGRQSAAPPSPAAAAPPHRLRPTTEDTKPPQ